MRLAPDLPAAPTPPSCILAGILPHSPADTAGLKSGDRLLSINGARPADASAVSNLIQNSGPEADFEIAPASGAVHHVTIPLNKEKPRLGALCDLTGLRKPGVTPAGNESVAIFEGPYVLTLSGVINEKLVFMRVHLSNYSDHPLTVDPLLFQLVEADQSILQALSPADAMVFLHGKDWKHETGEQAKSDADYLKEDSLRPTVIVSGGSADGLIYFLQPKGLPFTIRARLEGHTISAGFGAQKSETRQMTQDQLSRFFEAEAKGTPLRLALRGGKIFVGKFSSYDALNEIVWFDTPSAGLGLLNTTSFGLRRIFWVEPISPSSNDKKTNPSGPAD